ncbi:MAG TPA: S1 RNA-binding domain-containing protein [Spirochaetota bacterium]|nr:S1 RNA-binding domain-containing protein [Spirochaetota bacterium]
MSDEINFDLEKSYNDSFKFLEENSLVKATVVDISGDTVFLDIGAKSEAKVSVSEFEQKLNIGDVIDIYLVKTEGRAGDPVVSKKKADMIAEKREAARLFKEREIAEGVVHEAKSVGFVVKFKSIYGFIPFSLFDNNKIEKPESFVGKKIKFYFEKLNFKNVQAQNQKKKLPPNRKERIEEEFIANRKKVLVEENNVLKLKFLEDKKEGDIVTGEVKNLTEFGAFVDLGGIEALLHIKDISWLKIDKVEDALKVGDKIKVKILLIDKTKGKVAVGLKQTQEEPWDKFVKVIKLDDVVKGTVTSLTSYGAFVRVYDGVEGLLHISDMSWTKSIKNPSELLKKGQQIEVKVINIDTENKKINLSLKHLLENPWDKVEQKYKVGAKITGKIKNIAAFGVFIELEEGIDALLHIDDISWTENVRNPHKRFKVGDEIEAVVIQCDSKTNKIKVGMKQLTDDPWKKLKDNYNSGDLIECVIESIDEVKGVCVKVIDDVSTYIPLNQLEIGRIEEIKAKLNKDYKVGDTIKALITEINFRTKQIKLSVKEYFKKEENKKVQEFLHDDKQDDKFTLGDMLKSKKQ